MAAAFVDIMVVQDVEGYLPCPIAIHTISGILLNFHPGDHPYTVVMYRLPDVLRQVLRFLMRPRTSEARRALADLTLDDPGLCRCAENDALWSNGWLRDAHDFETRYGRRRLGEIVPDHSALQLVLSRMTDLLAESMVHGLINASTTKIIARTQDAARRGDVLPWPTNQTDVFPFGIETSVASLCAWTEFYQDTALLAIINMCVDVICPTFTTVLVRTIIPSVFPHVLAQCGGDDLEEAVRRFLSIASPLYHLNSLGDRRLRTVLGGDKKHTQLLVDILKQCGTVGIQIQHRVTQSRETLRGDVDVEELKEKSRAFFELAQKLRSSLTSDVDQPLSDDELVDALAQYSSCFLRPVICARVGCEDLGIGHKLRRCSGCMVVYYCSTACQKAAWRHPALPHKSVCETLCLLSGVLYIPADKWEAMHCKGQLLATLALSSVDIIEHLEGLYT